jgi:hypothetical protein
MERIVSFYEKLPRGRAPEIVARGPFARYRKRYFGNTPSAARTQTSSKRIDLGETKKLIKRIALLHLLIGIMTLGYAQEYYFHLRMFARKRYREIADIE